MNEKIRIATPKAACLAARLTRGRGLVAREIVRLGGRPVLREGVVTDNGNVILDVHGLAITDPAALEGELNQLPGVVTNGLFARRPADVLLLGTPTGVRRIDRAVTRPSQ